MKKIAPLHTRTKIICTIGPSCDSLSALRDLIQSGMSLARLNFSHNTHAYHSSLISRIRQISKQEQMPVGIIQDLQGPKIRLGKLPEEGVFIHEHEEIILDAEQKIYDFKKPLVFPVSYKQLYKDVSKADQVFIDDGMIEAQVVDVKGKKIFLEVKNGGMLFSHKGFNFPKTHLSISSLTDKDKKDLRLGLQKGVDFIALSFVTSPKDILDLRRLIKKLVRPNFIQPKIIAKIEKHEAIEAFDQILDVTDAVMIARGDLGMEIPIEMVPIKQKQIIEKCRQAGKPVIVATQMLDSMIRSPRPTRAEVSDVANAVIDHTDAVMLSGETATGKYPLKATGMMARVIQETEASRFDNVCFSFDSCTKESIPPDISLCHLFQKISNEGQVDAILSATFLTSLSEYLNIFRPEIPLFIASDTQGSVAQLNLRWGVFSFLLKSTNISLFTKHALNELQKKGWVKKGMRLAVVISTQNQNNLDVQFLKVAN
ncbi:pyruvate kinase [Candidatus Uhrbacteria bacterium CG_4_9_14_3_um_filter_36_7]|uniref:Pyruvate kinase n=1 Tax=Candidatus Uhrbacteria bacterium CG_4_9_14_3_um_filter_36_7 TaxID=1975033 RepID=A0A2M7XFX0_9BACT|nr:MAG: pyruvate kinase [Candidatus Uhrbacteria bacterium CG_4_9_14_3_um_filter_36_7]